MNTKLGDEGPTATSTLNTLHYHTGDSLENTSCDIRRSFTQYFLRVLRAGRTSIAVLNIKYAYSVP